MNRWGFFISLNELWYNSTIISCTEAMREGLKKIKIRRRNIFFLLDSSMQKLITLVWKGLMVMGTSSPMQAFKFLQGITWPLTNLVKTYEKILHRLFLTKKKNNAIYNRTETIFIFAVTENEIFSYNMIYALRFTERWINSTSMS